jgi:hypothetical protein
MSELTTEMCAFPGCERPAVPAPEGAGRPSRYCDVPEHNAQSAFRERRRRAAAGELDGSDGAEQGGGERPVSLAGATLRAVAARLIADLERTRDALSVLTDTEQLEAELAAVRADTQAEVAHAAQHEAAARRERMEADEAAESALRAAAEAEERARAASERADGAMAAQAAAEASATRSGEQAQEAVARAEQAEKERAAALARAQDAEQERSQALEQVRQAQLERQGRGFVRSTRS